jgi:hypothetical protein
MRSSPARSALALGLVALALGCSEPAAPPHARDGSSPNAAISRSSLLAFTASLSGVPDASGVPYAGYGLAQILIARAFPAGPCRPEFLPAVQRGQTLVSLCSFIDNAGGGLFIWFKLAASGGPSLAPIVYLMPTAIESSPCRSYLIRGAVALDDAVARAIASNPSALDAIVAFQAVDAFEPPEEMRGTFGTVTPPDVGLLPAPSGDPYCMVTVSQLSVGGQ